MSRQEISELFRRLRDEKLLMGSSPKAIELGLRAYELAGAPGIVGPWRQVAAYRLAHLKLRSETLDESSLNQILDLLIEAAGEEQLDAIGPLPLIYQMPVNSLLAELQPERGGELDALNRQVFEKAVQRFTYCHSGPDGENEPILAQSQDFNLLELAAYFTRQDYSRLLGCGGTHQEISGSWCLLSNRGHSPAIQYNQSFANTELDSVLQRHPDAIAFRQLDALGNWEWWTEQTSWNPWNAPERARLIAIAIAKSEAKTGEVANILDITQNAVSKAKGKLVIDLKEKIPDRDPEQLQWGTFATATGEIPIFMAVESRSFKPLNRR